MKRNWKAQFGFETKVRNPIPELGTQIQGPIGPKRISLPFDGLGC